MTTNQTPMTLNIRRIDICDLLIACTVAKETAMDGGEKWEKLHDEIKRQLNEQDDVLVD